MECGCIVTLTHVHVDSNSEELTRRIVCPHNNAIDFLTKAGKYALTVETVSKGTIESHLNFD